MGWWLEEEATNEHPKLVGGDPSADEVGFCIEQIEKHYKEKNIKVHLPEKR